MTRLARHGVLAVGVATLTAHMACGRDSGPAILLDEGVSWALAEWRARTLSDIHYTYHLRVPRALEIPLEGTLVAQFQWLDARANDLVLDFKDPAARIRGVRVNGAPVEWEARHDHVVVPAGALTSGDRNRVDVEFQAGDEALNRNEDFLYTLFVPDRAHFSLPLFDQPNLKARFSLTLEVPDGWVAVANGSVTEETAVNARGTERGTTYHFAETEPIPTYLFAFAVGNFQIDVAERAGRTLRMFHRETDAEKVARNREAIFDLHAVALEWLEDYTQIAYPFGKFDFVLVPPFQYGGMEHPGSIFYRQSSLLLDASATQAHYLGRASLIAHETTHMWFGDLVTMSWFDDVWTKEVFANFMAAKIVHPSFPDVNHDLRFFLAHHNTAYAVDRSAGANPIRQPLENLKAAGSLYGPIIYQKAPIVMRQLERLVGEDLFRDGLREYLHTFRYGNATWPDLIDILDRRADAGLAAWSEAWVDEPGRPVVTTERLDDADRADRLRVSQDDPHDQGRLWPQQLELLLSYEDRNVRIPLSLSGASASLGWDGRARPNFVLPNASGIEYGHFRLDPGSVDYLMSNLPDLEDSLTRGIVWVTLWGRRAGGRDRAERLVRAPAERPRDGDGRAEHATDPGISRHDILGLPGRRPASGECPTRRVGTLVGARRCRHAHAQRGVLSGVEANRPLRRRPRADETDLGGTRGRTRGASFGARLHGARRGAGRSRGRRGRRHPGTPGRADREPRPPGPLHLRAARLIRGFGGTRAVLRGAARPCQPGARAVGARGGGLPAPPATGRARPPVRPPESGARGGDPAHG